MTGAKAANVDVKTLMFRPEGLLAEMPFTNVPGHIPCGLERFGQRGLGERKFVNIRGGEESADGAAADVIGDTDARGIFAGFDGSAGGGTDGASRICVGEVHRLAGKAIDVGGFIEGGTSVMEVAPSHVVDENQDDIGM